MKKPVANDNELPHIPEPSVMSLHAPYALMVTGVGGTGIVTIAALIGMAAHLDGLGCGIIDMAGLAQKGGSVVSHVKLAPRPEDISAIRIAPGTADLLIGGDLIVSASNPILDALKNGQAKAVINTHEMMPSDFTSIRDLTLPTDDMHTRILGTSNPDTTHFLNATAYARQWLGDSIGANLFLLGVAWQSGYLPLSFQAIDKAIELNNVAVDFNRRAFALGRLWVHEPVKLTPAKKVELPESTQQSLDKHATLDELLARYGDFLSDYQNVRYAKRYQARLQPLIDADKSPDKRLSRIAAKGLFKLMAYKDEYEVARLYSNGDFYKKIQEQFEGDVTLSVHLAPPLFSSISESTGRPIKKQYGSWMFKLFGAMAKLKGLRGTPLNGFGYTAERRREVALIKDYEQHINAVVKYQSDTSDFLEAASELLSLPESIRGFGPVKEASMVQAKTDADALLSRLQGNTHKSPLADGKAA